MYLTRPGLILIISSLSTKDYLAITFEDITEGRDLRINTVVTVCHNHFGKIFYNKFGTRTN